MNLTLPRFVNWQYRQRPDFDGGGLAINVLILASRIKIPPSFAFIRENKDLSCLRKLSKMTGTKNNRKK